MATKKKRTGTAVAVAVTKSKPEKDYILLSDGQFGVVEKTYQMNDCQRENQTVCLCKTELGEEAIATPNMIFKRMTSGVLEDRIRRIAAQMWCNCYTNYRDDKFYLILYQYTGNNQRYKKETKLEIDRDTAKGSYCALRDLIHEFVINFPTNEELSRFKAEQTHWATMIQQTKEKIAKLREPNVLKDQIAIFEAEAIEYAKNWENAREWAENDARYLCRIPHDKIIANNTFVIPEDRNELIEAMTELASITKELQRLGAEQQNLSAQIDGIKRHEGFITEKITKLKKLA